MKVCCIFSPSDATLTVAQAVLPTRKHLSTSKCFAIYFQAVFIDFITTTTILYYTRFSLKQNVCLWGRRVLEELWEEIPINGVYSFCIQAQGEWNSAGRSGLRFTGIMYGLLTKCEVKVAGYWPSSFAVVQSG